MKRWTIFALAYATIWLASCGGGEKAAHDERRSETPTQTESAKAKEERREPSNTDEMEKKEGNQNATPPIASNLNLKQTNREFVRTADVRFQVKNVYKTTLEMENLVAQYQGFITETTLRNEVVRTEELEVSRDSVLRIMMYRVNNQLTIRLPQDSLDTFMHKLGKWLVFLDHRIIKAEDVTLALKANDLKAKRSNNYEQRYTKAIDNQGKKLDETANAEDRLLQRQNEADQNLLNQEALRHQVQYSTLNLTIYQPETIHRSMIENYRKIEQYQPSFWAKMADSLYTGWKVILNIIVGLTAGWPFLILLGIGLWLIISKGWLNKK